MIERPIVGEFDLSGWELRKALRLFRRSNPPLIEWLGSPIVYRECTTLASRLRTLAARHHSPRSCAYHYLNMARRNHAAYLQGDRIRLKKYLSYCARSWPCGGSNRAGESFPWSSSVWSRQ